MTLSLHFPNFGLHLLQFSPNCCWFEFQCCLLNCALIMTISLNLNKYESRQRSVNFGFESVNISVSKVQNWILIVWIWILKVQILILKVSISIPKLWISNCYNVYLDFNSSNLFYNVRISNSKIIVQHFIFVCACILLWHTLLNISRLKRANKIKISVDNHCIKELHLIDI